MDYVIESDPAAGPCLSCGIEVLGDGFCLGHDNRRLTPYCSRACAERDAEGGVFDEDAEEQYSPLDEPR